MAVRWRPSKGAIGHSRDQGPVAPSSTTDPYRDDDDDRASRPLILNPEYAQSRCSAQHPERTTFLIGPGLSCRLSFSTWLAVTCWVIRVRACTESWHFLRLLHFLVALNGEVPLWRVSYLWSLRARLRFLVDALPPGVQFRLAAGCASCRSDGPATNQSPSRRRTG